MRNGCRHFQPVRGWLLTAPVEFHFLAAAASLFARTPDEEPCGRFIPAVGERKSPRRDLTLGFKPHSRGFSQSIYHVYHFTVSRACGWACLVMKPLKFPQSADLMPTPQVSRFCRAGLCAHGVKGLVSARLWVAVARAGSWIPHCNAASDHTPGTDDWVKCKRRLRKRGKVNENWHSLKVEYCPPLEVVLHICLLLVFNQQWPY